MPQNLKLEDFEDASFDPFKLEEEAFGATKDPYPLIAEKLRESWVHPCQYRTWFTDVYDQSLGEFPHYTILGYDKVEYVLTNPELFTNEVFKHSLGHSFGKTISAMDAPDHPRYRRIFQKAFMPNVVKHWGESLVQPVVDSLLNPLKDQVKADLYNCFARHYPFQIIYKQLNLPEEDVKLFHKLAITQTLHTVDMEKAEEAGRKLGVYFGEILKERRENPSDDIISLLGQAEVEGERLPDDVVVSFLRQLINAGGDTTYRATSVLLTGLLQNPDQLEAVSNDRSLIPQAIEEAVRWDGPVLVTRRWVPEDIEVDGVLLKGGSGLDVCLGSANRDESRWKDPENFDIFRERAPRQFPFALGPHVCIGQHLARVEMERALNSIFDNFRNLRLDPDMPPPELFGFAMRVPMNIHVVFDPV